MKSSPVSLSVRYRAPGRLPGGLQLRNAIWGTTCTYAFGWHGKASAKPCCEQVCYTVSVLIYSERGSISVYCITESKRTHKVVPEPQSKNVDCLIVASVLRLHRRPSKRGVKEEEDILGSKRFDQSVQCVGYCSATVSIVRVPSLVSLYYYAITTSTPSRQLGRLSSNFARSTLLGVFEPVHYVDWITICIAHCDLVDILHGGK